MKKINLSHQDQFLLALDREDLPFNSHTIIEVTLESDISLLKKALIDYVKVEPLLRVVPNKKTGTFMILDFSKIETDSLFFTLEEKEEESFFIKPFMFPHEIAIRMGVVTTKEKIKIIFSYHHFLFDGHAQFIFLEELLKVARGEKVSPRKNFEIYRFRYFFKSKNIKWYLRLFKNILKINKKKKNTKNLKIASLMNTQKNQKSSRHSRKLGVEFIEIDRSLMNKKSREYRLSQTTYLSLIALNSIHKILNEKGDRLSPIIIYITKSLRPELGAKKCLQNLIGMIWFKVERKELEKEDFYKKFKEIYKFRSSLDELMKIIFITGVFVKVINFKKIKEILEKKEKYGKMDSTLILSSGRISRDVIFPKMITVNKIYSRGTMHRSPGLGIMSTGFENKDIICIEYLKDMFNKETIAKLKRHMENELYG